MLALIRKDNNDRGLCYLSFFFIGDLIYQTLCCWAALISHKLLGEPSCTELFDRACNYSLLSLHLQTVLERWTHAEESKHASAFLKAVLQTLATVARISYNIACLNKKKKKTVQHCLPYVRWYCSHVAMLLQTFEWDAISRHFGRPMRL